MTDANPKYKALKEGIGCSVYVEPAYVLPAYLELGMKLSGQYAVAGQFINLGSATNAKKNEQEDPDIVRPHSDYMDKTEAFVDKMVEDGTIHRINMPKITRADGFDVIGHGTMPHKDDIRKARNICLKVLTPRL